MNTRNILAVVALSVSILTSAQNDFESIVNRILDNDPTLKSGRLYREAEIAGDKADNTPDAPELEFEHLWAAHPGEKNRMGFSVSQSFDWPGIYRARRSVVKAKSDAFDMLYRAELSQRRLELKQLLIDIVYTRQRMTVADRMCEIFDSLLEKYREGFEHGEYSRLDYGKIKIERVKSQRAKTDLNLQLSQLKASLSIFNGGESVDDIVDALNDFPVDKMLSLADYEQLQLQSNPSVRLSSLNEEVSRLQRNSDKKALLPGFSVGYRYAREDGNNFHGLIFGMSLPFIYGTKAKSHKSQLLVDAAESESDATAIRLRADLTADYFHVESLRLRLDELSSATDISECMTMLHKALAGGEISLIQYLLEVNYYNELQLEILDFEYRYHLAVARLNRFV